MYVEAETLPENPFPLEAVATYGKIVKSCDELKYMNAPLEELTDYLRAYHEPSQRYGAAIGIRGGHGSGKTHLLIRLAEIARNFETIEVEVLYAKADKANFYDLYFQLMSALPREFLQDYLGLAMTNIAIEHVQKAKATESISERIQGPEDLPKLYGEGNLARDQLLTTLQQRLEATQVPVEIPRILMQIDNPTYGDKAYQWLIGNEVQKPEDLGLSRSLLKLETGRVNGNEGVSLSAAPDVTAVDALETIAALVSIAERPLIVLIDQLEVLFRIEDKSRRETLFSVIKKLIEQLKGHNVLMFIAGNDEAWDMMPRDVSPRLRQREPLLVGNLEPAETQNLLDSYTGTSRGTHFSAENARVIHNLSGGSPRESIRIAYHAFNRVKGELKNVDEPLLEECAAMSGSIADRNRLALQQAESVLRPFGMLVQDLEVQPGVLIDLLLIVNHVGVLALVTAKPTDRLSEVGSARRIQEVTSYLNEKYPRARLIVVSVGYSSGEVQQLLSTTSTVIQFNERQFAHQLKTKATEIVAESYQKPDDNNAQTAAVIQKAVYEIVSRLDKIEKDRITEVNVIAERFSERAEELNRPVREEREMRTRFEVRDALDSLQEVLLRGWEGWIDGPWRRDRWYDERERIKSILVASEANLRVKHFDDVGAIYQDLLSEERAFWKELDKLEGKLRGEGFFRSEFPAFASMPLYKRKQDPRWILSEILKLRQDLITAMRRLLQGPTPIQRVFEKPWLFSLVPAIGIAFAWLFSVVFSSTSDTYLQAQIEQVGPGMFVLRMLLFAVPVYGFSVGTLLLSEYMLNSRWQRAAARIRYLIYRYEKFAPEP